MVTKRPIIKRKSHSIGKNNRKLVKFSAVTTTKKPIKVKFKTKSGQNVAFKATKVVKKKKQVKFYVKRK